MRFANVLMCLREPLETGSITAIASPRVTTSSGSLILSACSRGTTFFGLSGAQGPVEVDGGAYEGEVDEGLGDVSQGLAGRSNLTPA
jgi:hypothetical protein